MATGTIKVTPDETAVTNLTPATGFANYNDSYALKAYRQGNLVSVAGFVKPTSALSAGIHTITTLPSGFRPAREKYYIMRGGGTDFWFLHINPGGNFDAYAYIDTATGGATAYPNGGLMPCDITFPINE